MWDISQICKKCAIMGYIPQRKEGICMTCTFFGHRDTPETVRPALTETLRRLVTTDGVDDFLVGHQGNFDRMVLAELRALQKEYPHIRYAVVLATLPSGALPFAEAAETVFPEGLETVPRRFAVARRNEWMLKQSQIVVTYVTHSTGGAAKYKEKAEKQGKRVLSVDRMP